MEIISSPLLEYSVSRFVLPGQCESGDLHFVCCAPHSVLIAVIDGIGHGQEAAEVASAAAAVLRGAVDEPIISLITLCHEKLRGSRGVVMSLASVDARHGMMTWLGVGNVQGVLIRADAKQGPARETLLLRAGVVGAQLPSLQAAVLPVFQGDTVVFATDGIKGAFPESLSALEPPRRAADRILERFRTGLDDALVLVARITEVAP
jgi:phosphoserine phosphatase RsbX